MMSLAFPESFIDGMLVYHIYIFFRRYLKFLYYDNLFL
jgi:hypothetical protein